MGLKLDIPDELGGSDAGPSPGGRPAGGGHGLGRLERRKPVVQFVRWVETWAL